MRSKRSLNQHFLNVAKTLLLLLFEITVSNADPVSEWNKVILDVIRSQNLNPPLASRNLAILHTAIYDAVNGIEMAFQPYLVADPGPDNASPEAAVSAAAYVVLTNLFPAQQASFQTNYIRMIDLLEESPGKIQGLGWGEFVARRILEARSNDGFTNVVQYLGDTNVAGMWRPTLPDFASSLLPQWALLMPFGMTNPPQFRPPPPPALSSSQYAAALNEVKLLGSSNSSARAANQTEIALFWADGRNTVTPPGHWNLIAQNISTNYSLLLTQSARMFALLNIALADAAIVSWDAKYHYNVWRPVTAIREADQDSNPETVPDPDWTPLIESPPFPTYTSGHSTFSKAAATILAAFFGADNLQFETVSDGLPGVTRSFTSFSQAADEAGISRVFGGIHFQFDNTAGQISGENVARYIAANKLRPRLIVTRLAPTSTQLNLLGDLNRTYVFQASSDLFSWSDISTNRTTTGPVAVIDIHAPNPTQRYYRVRLQ